MNRIAFSLNALMKAWATACCAGMVFAQGIAPAAPTAKAEASANAALYTIRFQLVDAEDISAFENTNSSPNSPPAPVPPPETGRAPNSGGLLPVYGVVSSLAAPMVVGGQQISTRGGESLWNGQATPPEGLKIISSPVVRVALGQEAIIENVTNIPVAYFTPAGADHPGLYAHHIEQFESGTSGSLILRPGGTPDGVQIEFVLTTTAVQETRLPLPEVALDVGPPIIDKREISGTLIAPLGEWCYVLVPNSGGSAPVLQDPRPRAGLFFFYRITASPEGDFRLHEAAAAGERHQVELLLEDGMEVNARDEFGKTPLHHAAANGHAETVSKLIALGADPALKDEDGRSARFYALQNGHTATAERLPGDPAPGS